MILTEDKHEYKTYIFSPETPIKLAYNASLHLPIYILIEDNIYGENFNAEVWTREMREGGKITKNLSERYELGSGLEFWLTDLCCISSTLEFSPRWGNGKELRLSYNFYGGD